MRSTTWSGPRTRSPMRSCSATRTDCAAWRCSPTAASAFAKGQGSSGAPTTFWTRSSPLPTVRRPTRRPRPSAAANGWASCCAGTAEASTSAPAQRFLSDHGSRHAICQHPKPDAEAPGKTLGEHGVRAGGRHHAPSLRQRLRGALRGVSVRSVAAALPQTSALPPATEDVRAGRQGPSEHRNRRHRHTHLTVAIADAMIQRTTCAFIPF